LENARNILFWEKRSATDAPDAQALIQIFESADIALLMVNRQNEVCYASPALVRIVSNKQIKINFLNLLQYQHCGSERISVFTSQGTHISIQSFFNNWHGEQTACFILNETAEVFPAGNKSEITALQSTIAQLHTPVFIFKNEVLFDANRSAQLWLDISTIDFGQKHFQHLFGKIRHSVAQNTLAYLTDAVMATADVKSGTHQHEQALLCINKQSLDDAVYQIIEILPAAEEEIKTDDQKMSAHEVMTMASHDLREPVRTILNYTQLSLDKLKNGKYKQAAEYAELTREAAHRMDSLLSDLKTLVSIDDIQKDFIATSLTACAKDACKELEKEIKATKAEVNIADMPKAMVHPKYFTMALKLIIENAIKFHKEGKAPIVDIAAEQVEDGLLLCIRDNGIGISKKYHSTIFEQFKRLNRVDLYPGNGLGLTICKKIAELHDADISLESVPQIGTSFYIHLKG
jgi:signal transduction histidine kinase